MQQSRPNHTTVVLHLFAALAYLRCNSPTPSVDPRPAMPMPEQDREQERQQEQRDSQEEYLPWDEGQHEPEQPDCST